MINKKSEKFIKARVSLPSDLKPVYDALVEQYYFHTVRLFGRGYIAYGVLASLVRDGWRCCDKPNDR